MTARYVGTLGVSALALVVYSLIAGDIPLYAQGQPRPPSVSSVFQPLNAPDLPGPNAYRDASGAPGPQYWQQRADYDIHVALDVVEGVIEGTETIRYTNNSPTALEFIWLQLDRDALTIAAPDVLLKGEWDLKVSDITVNGREVNLDTERAMARVDLPEAIPARGGIAVITMHFHFRPSGHFRNRFYLWVWYPRVAVYDDVRGWNTAEEDGGYHEFYLEYGDFNYDVTVPDGYTVAGSGILANAEEVLTAVERARLEQARHSSSTVSVITPAEAQKQAANAPQLRGTKTWRFIARNVRSVAWAAAPDFRWDAASWNGTLCQALYPASGSEDFERAVEYTRWSIQWFSEHLAPFPFPQTTSVVVFGGAREAPMLSTIGGSWDGIPAWVEFNYVNHESVGHQYFPMAVGSNERSYGWMDEMLNGFFNLKSEEDAIRRGLLAPSKHDDAPGFTLELTDRDLLTQGSLAGQRYVAALFALRNQVIGPATFDLAMTIYYQRWAFKHPTPVDFYRTFENVSGQDLTWFWREFSPYYQDDVLDLGIESVKVPEHPPGATVIGSVVRVRRYTTYVFPVEVYVKFADGSTRDLHMPASAFKNGFSSNGDFVDISVWGTTPVVGARLWPHQARGTAHNSTISELPMGSVPDVNPANDVWGDAPAPIPAK